MIPKEIVVDEDITFLNGFHLPLKTKYYLVYDNQITQKNILDILKWTRENSIPVTILGQGTNTVFLTDSYEGLVIHIQTKGITWIDNQRIQVLAGEKIGDIVEETIKKDEQKFHAFSVWKGLPGNLWWAVVGNAWCFWLEIKNLIQSVSVFDSQLEIIKEISGADCEFGYRESIFKKEKHLFIESVILDLGFLENFVYNLEEVEEKRRLQPKWRTCGSFFKNPPNQSAGKIIDELGLKEFSVGGAFISPQHANFLMCREWATYEDIARLVHQIKYRAYTEKGVLLDPEVNIIS